MPDTVRGTIVALALPFFATGLYHRARSQQSGDKLDRSKEGWPTFIAIRVLGLSTMGSTAAWLWNPSWFAWAAVPTPGLVRWLGVAAFAGSMAWLMWMFVSLGTNLTDTVVTRRDAYLVERGPYHYVRNPMYTGVLLTGLSLGLALGTWLLPLSASVMFLLFAKRTRTEEQYLIARFGDRYRDYMARVGRFFPRLQ